MGPAQGIGERLLALEAAVAALQAELRELKGAGEPVPSGKGQASRKRVPTKVGGFPEGVEGLSNDDNCDDA